MHGVPMMMLVTAGRPTYGVRDPQHFAYNIRTNNTVGAKIVTIALGETLDGNRIAQIRLERGMIAREIDQIHRQMQPWEGYDWEEAAEGSLDWRDLLDPVRGKNWEHISPKDRRVFMKRLEGWDGAMDLTGEFLDMDLLELVHRHTCGKLVHVREERPDTVEHMVKLLVTELAVPLLFNISVTVDGADFEVPRETAGMCTQRILPVGGEISLPGSIHENATYVTVSVTGRGAVGRTWSTRVTIKADAAPTMAPRVGGSLLAIARVDEMMSYQSVQKLIGERVSLCQTCREECEDAYNDEGSWTEAVCGVVCYHVGNSTTEDACELTGDEWTPPLIRREGSRSIPAYCTNGGNAFTRDLCERTGFVFTPRTNRSATTRAEAAMLAATGLPGGGPSFWTWPSMTAVEVQGWPDGTRIHTPSTTFLRHIPRRHYRAPVDLPVVRPFPPILAPDPIIPDPRPAVDWAALGWVTLGTFLFIGSAVVCQIGQGVGWFRNGLPELAGIEKRQMGGMVAVSYAVVNSGVYCTIATCSMPFSVIVLLLGTTIISIAGAASWHSGEVVEVTCPKTGMPAGTIIRIDREGRAIKNYYIHYPTIAARRNGPTSMVFALPPH